MNKQTEEENEVEMLEGALESYQRAEKTMKRTNRFLLKVTFGATIAIFALVILGIVGAVKETVEHAAEVDEIGRQLDQTKAELDATKISVQEDRRVAERLTLELEILKERLRRGTQ